MILTLEQVDKRLEEIPRQLASIQAEHNQLLGYKQALADAEVETTPKNGEVMPPPKKEKKSKVAKAA